MEKGIFRNKTAIGKLVIIALVVIAVVGGIGAAYYLSLPALSASPSPSPTTSSQSSSSPSQSANPTQNPATSSSSTGTFKVGAYANYVLTSYLADPAGTATVIKLNVSGEESYSGTSCWVYTMTTESDSYGVSTKVITTRWLSKSSLECLHIRVLSYVNGNMVDDQEYAGDSDEGAEMPKVITATVGTETITVTAGTFNNCVKDEQTGATSGSGSREWVSVDVPIWGLVKLEAFSSSGPLYIYELTEYGGL